MKGLGADGMDGVLVGEPFDLTPRAWERMSPYERIDACLAAFDQGFITAEEMRAALNWPAETPVNQESTAGSGGVR